MTEHATMPELYLYVPDLAMAKAWLVDVDGTLALHHVGPGARSPYDWHRVGEDAPNRPVIDLVTALAERDFIVVMSGRDECCRPETEAWLATNVPCYTELHMRPAGDMRKDSIVKRELFETLVAPRWNVLGVIDDRDQVVAMWRSIGLMCAQVAPGNF